MDAGGLTREWYSVLAREIFNANYALFSATSDSVTFQPNPQVRAWPRLICFLHSCPYLGPCLGPCVGPYLGPCLGPYLPLSRPYLVPV
jgi:hypothetical protein